MLCKIGFKIDKRLADALFFLELCKTNVIHGWPTLDPMISPKGYVRRACTSLRRIAKRDPQQRDLGQEDVVGLVFWA